MEPYNFINETEIWEILEKAKNPSRKTIEDILLKATQTKGLQGLTLFETAVLIQNQDKEVDELIFETARKVKQELYGNRIVLFAPLYITNECNNICTYCGFNALNKDLHRKTLTIEEIKKEVEIIEDMGHKRLLLVYGEHPKFKVDWMVKTIEAVYSVRSKKSGEIRRVNINCAPMSVEDFKVLKTSNIGTYQCFQETYHKETYESHHLAGHKKDYLYRLNTIHRAQEAGIDDVGMGVLFGLFDYKFEVLALLTHAKELEKVFGVGPHTISFPRIEPAMNSEVSENPPYQVDDYDFKRIVAIIRLAVPYTGLILSTRENAEFRRELLKLGVSQISAGSRTSPGAYENSKANDGESQQFTMGDTRSLDEIMQDLISNLGYLPSFCTSCYRSGRTGEHFMELVKPGFIYKFCEPNAIVTVLEYLLDYGSQETIKMGEELILKEIDKIQDPNIKKAVLKRVEEVRKGKRDTYF